MFNSSTKYEIRSQVASIIKEDIDIFINILLFPLNLKQSSVTDAPC